MKKYFLASLSLLIAIMFTSVAHAGSSDPIKMLQSVADEMIASLKKNQVTLQQNPALVYALANKIIVPHADLAEMSMRVLPPQTWKSASAGQRAAFQREFTTLLVRTYASALAQYKDQTIRFFPIRGSYADKSTLTVDSRIIRSDGPAISVNYRLVLKGSSWKLYDMTVEGVSMLESFRSQFADQLARGNIEELMKVLRQHNADNAGN